jgi:hypothetical protein
VCVLVLICLIGIRVRVYIRICNWVVLMSVSQKTRRDQPEKCLRQHQKSDVGKNPLRETTSLERKPIHVLQCPYWNYNYRLLSCRLLYALNAIFNVRTQIVLFYVTSVPIYIGC